MTAQLYYPPLPDDGVRAGSLPTALSPLHMPSLLAQSASAPAPTDLIGAPAAALLFGAHGYETGTADTDPAAAQGAVGAALRALSPRDASAVLEALSEQAAALSLVLAADSAGAISLPDSLRSVVAAASVLPAFLGGAS